MQSALGAGGGCMEEVGFKLEKDGEAGSPGRWTSARQFRAVGACMACLGAAPWCEVPWGRERPRQEGLECEAPGFPLGGSGQPPTVYKHRSDRSRSGSSLWWP